MAVHPSAVIEDGAELGEVEVGPFALVGAGAKLADGVVLEAHAVVLGGTTVGPRTRVGTHAVLGGAPQDVRGVGQGTRLEIGADNVFRELTTVHRGATGLTRIGDGNLFMASSHVAHDVTVGSGCTLSTGATLSAHVSLDDGVILGSMVGVHPQVRVGRLAMLGLGAMCAQDVPPFSLAQGDRARLFGLHVTGLKRAGFDEDVMTALKQAWRTLFTSGLPLRAAMGRVREDQGDQAEVAELLDFLERSERGICRAAGRR